MKSSVSTLANHISYPFISNVHHNFWQFLDWLFPPYCGGCEKPGVRWCSSCQDNTTLLTNNICPCCGALQTTKEVCPDCRQSRPPYSKLRSWGIHHGPLKNAIHKMKYNNDVGLAEAFRENLIKVVVQMDCAVDLITAVPLSKDRLRTRGYNQAALLAACRRSR